MMSHFAEPTQTLDEGVSLAFHILNTMDIPKGLNKFKNEYDEIESDFTQWVVVKDLSRATYFVRMYDSPQVSSVDLKKLDWDAVDGKQLDVPTSPISGDLTAAAAAQAIPTVVVHVLPPSGDTGA